MMQLDITHFQKPKDEPLKVESVKLEDLPDRVKENEALVLRDECRVREGDILPPLPSTVTNRIPPALRGIALSKISSRAELMCALSHNLPRNEYGMPKIFYRPDLLDPSLFRTQEDGQSNKFQAMQDALDASTIVLNYHEGYPALPVGTPLWQRFEWESTTDFDYFSEYLKLPGARQASLLTGPAQEAFTELFHTNYWAIRCQASDTFAVVHHQRMREQRILSTDDKHFLASERLLTTLSKMEAEIDWEALKGDPKQFVEVMERLIKIQRAALGHTAQGGGDKDRSVQSVEVIMRKTAAETLSAPDKKPEGLDIQSLLSDPASVEQAQELILRVGMK